jgi:hypothetical protein
MFIILQNNVYLSIIAGVVVALFLYVDNRRLQADKRLPVASYFKILLVTAVLTYIVLYIRTRKFDIPKLKGGGSISATTSQVPLQEAMTNVNIGDPDF